MLKGSEVSVALSSFNGERYIAQQLDSILAQIYENIAVQVRDDGSSDETTSILEIYSSRYGNIHVSCGERLGVAGSFFRLLRESPASSEYFAFSDQDDVWDPDKVKRAVSMLSHLRPGLPGLYCSRLEYVDEQLKHIRYSDIPRREMSFSNALAENRAIGCTIMLNRAARDLILTRLPHLPIMHDWWCYLVVSAFGKVVYDASPTVKYRLHGANEIGAAVSHWGTLVRRLQRFMTNPQGAFSIHRQALEFQTIFGLRVRDEERDILARLIESKGSLIKRLRFALGPNVYRQSTIDDVLLRLLIVAGWY